jgi:hypothetical protein
MLALNSGSKNGAAQRALCSSMVIVGYPEADDDHDAVRRERALALAPNDGLLRLVERELMHGQGRRPGSPLSSG